MKLEIKKVKRNKNKNKEWSAPMLVMSQEKILEKYRYASNKLNVSYIDLIILYTCYSLRKCRFGKGKIVYFLTGKRKAYFSNYYNLSSNIYFGILHNISSEYISNKITEFVENNEVYIKANNLEMSILVPNYSEGTLLYKIVNIIDN